MKLPAMACDGTCHKELFVIATRKSKKEQDTETMLSGSDMALLSMLVQQISEIRQKPTLLGPDPPNTSSCFTLDKIAIIEGVGSVTEGVYSKN
jgi:hypothetical protein